MTHNPKLNNIFAPSYEQDTENSEENRSDSTGWWYG